MTKRPLELVVLLVCAAVIGVVAIAGGTSGTESQPSTYDGGPRGYEALFHVLDREDVPVARLRVPLGAMPPQVRVLAITGGGDAPGGLQLDANDIARAAAFVKRGGRLALFIPAKWKMPKSIAALPKARVLRFDVARYDNAALETHPERAADVYAALAGHGQIAFDERVYGYDDTRSLWSVLPQPVRAACLLVLAMLALVLIDANVPFVPPAPIEPPNDRDSSAYIVSMAALLRRGRAARAAVARFARTYPNDAALARLAALIHPSDAALVRAAQITASRRKDHA